MGRARFLKTSPAKRADPAVSAVSAVAQGSYFIAERMAWQTTFSNTTFSQSLGDSKTTTRDVRVTGNLAYTF